MTLSAYLVKDNEGEQICIIADGWTVGNGLRFSIDDTTVFWLTGWQHFRKLEGKESKIRIKNYLANQE
tara:strand:+ start:206 stop:409 length:204 start_codon:yes stop_codon:yes gene_type:complete